MDSVAQVGSLAPDFVLEDLEGEKHSLRDELGSIVVLNFWSADFQPRPSRRVEISWTSSAICTESNQPRWMLKI